MESTVLEERRRKPQWFLKLLEDLRELLGKEQEHRTMLIEMRHAIGKRIIEEQKKPYFYQTFESIPVYMATLSKELGISNSELYAYTKLVEKFPDPAMFSDVREHQISWHTLEHEILYPSKKDTEKAEKEVKLCELEELLQKLSMVVHVQKDQTLNCGECEIKGECDFVKTKLSPLREKFGD